MATIDEREVLSLVGEVAPKADGRQIEANTSLEEIGFDSLAFAELAAAMLERYGLDLVDSQSIRCATAGDLARIVERAAARERFVRDAHPAGIGRRQAMADRLGGGVLRWWFDIMVEGADRMPSSGPVVLCMNHESLLDIPVAVLASPRPVTFMAKRELFRSKAGARFFHALGGFSVDRAGFDLRAVEIALEVVRRGQVLGMYPEGTRTPGVLLPFLSGAAWVALHDGAPLLPAAVVGTEASMPPGRKIPKRVPIRVEFADPIPVDAIDDPAKRRVEAELLTGELRSVIEAMIARLRPVV